MTDLDLRAGNIHRGLGVVARWPDIALVIPSDSLHDAVVDQMFSSLPPNPTSQTVIRAINSLLSEGKLRSVGMIVEATGGPMAVAFGPVEVLSDGNLAVSGADGIEKHQLSEKAQELTIRAADSAKAADPVPPFDLRRGIAPGAGLTLTSLTRTDVASIGGLVPPMSSSGSTSEPADEIAPAADPGLGAYQTVSNGVDSDVDTSMDAPFRSVVLINVPQPSGLRPLPIATETTGQPETLAESSRVDVEGIVCSRGHFNNPRSAYCMVCGMSMLHLTPNPVVRPRPTLGFIVFDDGSSFGLDRSYVIGREPVRGEDPTSELLTIHDNNDTLSRTHAELVLAGWNVQLVDLGSTNGTYIWDTAHERWNQLSPGSPVELHSGQTVALGRRTFVFESVSRT